jgi:hypothetical protein
MSRKTREIVEGQHYRKVGPAGGVWEVAALHTDASGAVHAKMFRVDEPKTFRTFSTGALTDIRNFQLVKDR